MSTPPVMLALDLLLTLCRLARVAFLVLINSNQAAPLFARVVVAFVIGGEFGLVKILEELL